MIIGPDGQTAPKIICAPGCVPAAGQYLWAWAAKETRAVLGAPLFLSQVMKQGFQAAPPVPEDWFPGMQLELWGPSGKGFRLPAGVRRLALVALGSSASRLMPLAGQVLADGGDVTLFSDAALPAPPPALEFFPLPALPEALPWADFAAFDLPLEEAHRLRDRLGLRPGTQLPCPGQALVWTPMPCHGLAACGACAVPARHGWKLACEDGPVFDVEDLLS